MQSNKILDKLNSILVLRVDKKQLINQLRAMNDNYIEMWIDAQNLYSITLKDRFNNNTMRTKN